MKKFIHPQIEEEKIDLLFDKIYNNFKLYQKNHQLNYTIDGDKIDIVVKKFDKKVFINVYLNDCVRVYINGKNFRNELIGVLEVEKVEKLIKLIREIEVEKEKILTELLGDFLNEMSEEAPKADLAVAKQNECFIKKLFRL